MLFELRVARADRRRLHRDLHAAGFCRTIEHELARGFIELAAMRREPEVVDFETRERVTRIECIAVRGAYRPRRSQQRERRKRKTGFNAVDG